MFLMWPGGCCSPEGVAGVVLAAKAFCIAAIRAWDSCANKGIKKPEYTYTQNSFCLRDRGSQISYLHSFANIWTSNHKRNSSKANFYSKKMAWQEFLGPGF